MKLEEKSDAVTNGEKWREWRSSMCEMKSWLTIWAGNLFWRGAGKYIGAVGPISSQQ